MATGQQAFKGHQQGQHHCGCARARSGAAVGRSPEDDAVRPDMSGGQPPMPWMLDQIVARCLAKNPGRPVPDRRGPQAGVEVDGRERRADGGAGARAAVARLAPLPRRIDCRWCRGVVVAAVAAAMNSGHRVGPRAIGRRGQSGSRSRPPPNAAFSPSSASLALSPDGRSLAFTASAGQGELALWIQSLDSLEAEGCQVPGRPDNCSGPRTVAPLRSPTRRRVRSSRRLTSPAGCRNRWETHDCQRRRSVEPRAGHHR